MKCSIWLINNIDEEDNYTIRHLCDSSSGSSGAPIISSSYQVIGIHKGAAEGAKNYNFGTFLNEPIEKFKNNKIENKKEIINNNELNNENKELKNNEKENIKNNELINEIKIEYKIDNDSEEIRKFGDEFVKNNKDKVKIIINEEELELCTHLTKNQINLKGINQVTNMSFFFW